MSVRTIVIDTSVALKWWLRDEEHAAEADELQMEFLCGNLNLIAPTLFDYEVINALKGAVVRKRIDEAYALSAISDLMAYDIVRRDLRSLHISAFQLACRYQRPSYDASYLALAQTLGLDFYTGDKRMFNAVSNAFAWMKWIGDYRS